MEFFYVDTMRRLKKKNKNCFSKELVDIRKQMDSSIAKPVSKVVREVGALK